MDFTEAIATKDELKVIEDWSIMAECALIRKTYYFPKELVQSHIRRDVEVL